VTGPSNVHRVKRLAIAGAVSAVGLGMFAPPASAQPNYFTTPDGNIGCDIYDFEARCDIKEYTFAPPTKPEDCPLHWGDALLVREALPGEFTCHIDSAFGDGPALAVGDSKTVAPMSCTVIPSGIQCRNTATQHGFELSRQAYRLY
jgi:hypothetical protein